MQMDSENLNDLEETKLLLQQWVSTTICDVTGLDPERVGQSARLEEIGMDSLAIVSFGTRIERHIQSLRRSFIYDCRTVGEICDHLLTHHQPELGFLFSQATPTPRQLGEGPVPEAAAPASEAEDWPEIVLADFGPGHETAQSDEMSPSLSIQQDRLPPDNAVAIIGVQGRFPGAASLDAFWQLIASGADLVGEIPADRWSVEGFYEADSASRKSGKSYSKWGAFLPAVDEFDAQFFGIPPRDARLMDPQERLFLECAYHAMEDAALFGARQESLSREGALNVGVFVGITTNTYSLQGPSHWTAGGVEVPTSMPWSSANRVSYFLNLSGPSVAVDTACSSSLVALHLAVESVAAGECTAAIAGGVNLYLHPAKYVQLCQYQMLSPTGRCHSFGADADGFVPGEGVAAVVLRPLRDALQNGDRILGVIRGTAVNHSGRTNGYTVPGAASQAALIRKALDRAALRPDSIGYIEAHGTGTKLGDPIEITGICDALGDSGQPCAIGSLKSNIGHLESAAGIAGIVKVLLQLRHDRIAPSIHSRIPNPDLKLDGGRYFVPQELGPWPKAASDGRRRAGISSFGAGGTCAHAIIEEGPEVPVSSAVGPLVFPLSAQSPEQLRLLAQDLLKWIGMVQPGDERTTLLRLAYTLQCGRATYRCRFAAAAASVRDLTAAISTFLREVATGAILGSRSVEDSEDERLAARWSIGEEVAWPTLWQGLPCPVGGLLYPFLRDRHALAPPEIRMESGRERQSEQVEIVVSHTLTGDESYIRDHVIGNSPILPGTAYVGLCSVLVRQAGGDGWAFDLQDLAWSSPYRWGPTAAKQLSVHGRRFGPSLSIEIASSSDARPPHFTARAELAGRSPIADREPISAIRERCTRSAEVAGFYALAADFGMVFGESFRCIARASKGRGEALVEAKLPTGSMRGGTDLPVDPGLLDAAFQSAFFAVEEGFDGPHIPVRAKAVRIHGDLGSNLLIHVQAVAQESDSSTFDYRLMAPSGAVIGEIKSLTFQRIEAVRGRSARAQGSINIFEPVWAPDTPVGLGGPPTALLALERQHRNDIRLGLTGRTAQVRLRPGGAFEIDGSRTVTLDPARKDHIEHLWRTFKADGSLPAAVVADLRYQPAVSPHGWEQDLGLGPFISAMPLLKSVVEAYAPSKSCRVILICQGPAASAAAAMMRSVHIEAPSLDFTVLETDGAEQAADLDLFIDAEAKRTAGDGVRHVRFIKGTPLVRRHAALDLPSRDADVRSGDVVLITGGLGAVGLHIAKHLAHHRGVRIALLGRSRPDEHSRAAVASLRMAEGDCGYWECDCSSGEDLAQTLADIRSRLGRLTGILHCAGVLKDAFFTRHTDTERYEVLKSKVLSARLLDEMTRQDPLRWFVLSSALAAVCGNIGQSVYGLSNGWLDGFAEERNSLTAAGRAPGRTVAVAWPLWNTRTGMQASERFLRRLQDEGLDLLEPDEGVRLFAAATWSDRPLIVPIKGDGERSSLILGIKDAGIPTGNTDDATLEPQAGTADANGGQEDRVLRYLIETLSGVTGTAPERIEPDTPLEAFGLDSLLVLEMSDRLQERFPRIARTALFEARTLRALARLLIDELPLDVAKLVASGVSVDDDGPREEPSHLALSAAVVGGSPEAGPTKGNGSAIAIVGLAGRYPGSSDLWDLWDHLCAGSDLVTELPPRLGAGEERSSVYAKWGSFIDDVDTFDPLFFGISPRDAERMDPQERIFLQTAWHAVEDAGYTPEGLSGGSERGTRRRVAVIAGVMYGEYQFFGATGTSEGGALTNSSYASIANRVSYCLDFDGPSFAVDSMCSSSLTSMHLACELLRSGGCDVALAGGVNISVHPYKYRMLSELKFAATDGRCRSFGVGGDGYVPGEGCGVVVLRPLEAAIAAGDHIYGVIRGSDIGHGARSSGYTVPNPDAQAEVVRRAFERGGVDPAELSYIEAHGTGTSLGDPIEIRGLSKALGKRFPEGGTCAIGSIKANIGHLESAAGIAGLTKVLLQMKHRRLVPSIHSAELNPFIDFSRTPFRVQREQAEWQPVRGRRLAAVSSFGAGGANAHLVVESWDDPTMPEAPSREPVALLLSSANEGQLRETARVLLKHLEREGEISPDAGQCWIGSRYFSLRDVALTLRHGRYHGDHRLAIIAADFDEFRRKLALFLRTDSNVGAASGDFERLGILIGGLQPTVHGDAIYREARAWVDGGPPPPPDAPWRRVPLPGYVFQRRRFWLGNLPAENEGPDRAVVDLHRSPSKAIDPDLTPSGIIAKVKAGDMTQETARELLLAMR
ncbi:SDR family NAD(P)-dependent oxidoreductase [Methylobacterium sp. R2-1]|uniref:SDR family NAD(P)-dependent oxidoreductase n=1 Tax=Methylobacterium sp. R2-1 TaxID=2587064 RepID=UPI0016144CFC|nr:SDR family NAD(P)-dependent oxidoreductase [Methylobacterium sp. R2-1]MBB2964259.1 polyketide synthase PksN [Methylobacterium sp. R2-1]